MIYNHHTKAGNQGDVIKHPALIAALDVVLRQAVADTETRNKSFHYLDAFTGHAWHPLLDEGSVPEGQKPFEWRKGIGCLHDKLWQHNALNEHVQLWRDWYL